MTRESPGTTAARSAIRYVALGDSYTIGTSVQEAERWPDQLVARLAADPPPRGPLRLVANLAVNGFTSAMVVRAQLPRLEEKPAPGFVSLLIGVNDVVQGVPEAAYRANVETILDRLLLRLPEDRIVCVETPDYTVTPRGAEFGAPVAQRAGIARVNVILQAACAVRDVAFVGGVFEVSAAAADRPELVASDGLHPSGEQYRRWVERIEPVVRTLLGEPQR